MLDTTKLISDDPNDSHQMIMVTFLDKVQVTKTDFLEFNLWTFLSSIGGSLGLWLGLGMLQLGEIILDMAGGVWN